MLEQTADVPADALEPVKPKLRGRLHEILFFLVVPAGAVLIAVAPTGRARFGAVVYTLCMAGMYGTSALYHLGSWSPSTLAWLKRIDHSMIYLLIAGTYTPLSLLALHGAWRVWILSIVWAGAAVGIFLKFLSVHGFTRVTSGLYIALGWLAVVATPQIVHQISPTAIALMIAGGLFFTGGVIVLGSNRPNPIPGTFGYHEVWHACTMAGTACHYGLILLVVLAAH